MRITEITRVVNPDRSIIPGDALKATGFQVCAENNMVRAIPRGEGLGKIKITFFTLDEFLSNDQLERAYRRRGTKPDPYAQITANQKTGFGRMYPNGTHWKNKRGVWRSLYFTEYPGEYPRVTVIGPHGWAPGWWFGEVLDIGHCAL